MMVAPKAPEGGWRRWFLDHPYQRTKYPILRQHDVRATYNYIITESGLEPLPTPTYEYVEMWYQSKDRKVYASLNGQPPDWLYFSANSSEHSWDDGVRDLFDHCMDLERVPPPPEPSGSGWDDFDWSI